MVADGYRFLAVPVQGIEQYVENKEESAREFATYFLIRIMDMFTYKGLPEEIPVDCLNKLLFMDGWTWFTKYKSTNQLGEEVDRFYVFNGKMGDAIDAYYRPTRVIISNPGANCYKDYLLHKQKGGTYYGDDGVILRNDTLYHGLMPLIYRYAYLLAENVITLHSADVFLRIIALISASDDKTVASANQFINNIKDGKMSTISEGKFFEGVKLQSPPSNNGSYLTQFIEYQQYFLGSFFNEIGLNANFNMKRESIAKSESSLNEDSMLPLCHNMLKCRREDLAVVNEMYGLNIEVDFNSAWLENALEIAMNLGSMASQIGGGNSANKAADENQRTEDGDGETSGGSDHIEESVQTELGGDAEESSDEEENTVEEGTEVTEMTEEPSQLGGDLIPDLEEKILIASGLDNVKESEEKKDEGTE